MYSRPVCVRASSERRERARLVTYLMLRLHETTFLLSLPLLTMNVALWTCRLDLIIERRIYNGRRSTK